MAFDAVDITPVNGAPHLDRVFIDIGHQRSPPPDPGVTVPLLILVDDDRVVREVGNDDVDVTAGRRGEILGDDRRQRARHRGVPSF